MLTRVRHLFRPETQESLIKKYTRDLSTITSQIHSLDKTLKKKDVTQAKWQRNFNIYGSSLLIALTAVLYTFFKTKAALWLVVAASFAAFIALKVCIKKWFNFSAQRTSLKMDKLKAEHQEKLEALKQKTHFYSTNSLIQRFSSGEYQAEDAITLMDEEMKKKHEELGQLQEELRNLKHQEDTQESQAKREKWFDKMLGVLSGGDAVNAQIRPIICQKCGKHAGSYMLPGMPLQYVCPLCGWELKSESADSVKVGDEKKSDSTLSKEPI
ncbi:LAMI_0C00914g1_1 [Lachancea mirantina]|uniref:Endoplasmic reticulum junction formation protein lunapark n=1 Tax=Lachancea mirantina TaxID=1230905 RepID=A0A1G4J0C2_9SACH|nr:LAMI_0C00914g1_1 [Lachancea mirantina]